MDPIATSTASISLRRSIAWNDTAPDEQTSTLVLTSPAKSFVDIRVYLPSEDHSISSPSHDLAHAERQLLHTTVDSTSIERLEWAFAGTAVSTPPKLDAAGNMTTPAHTRWQHVIDSKCETREEAADVADEGDMWPDPGEPSLEIETGKMPHPETKIVTPYEEIWQALDVLDAHDGGNDKICVVFQTKGGEDSSPVDGMIVRVGQFVQGILRNGKKLRVQRWQLLLSRNPADEHPNNITTAGQTRSWSWHCTVDVGDDDDTMHLPCALTWGTTDASGLNTQLEDPCLLPKQDASGCQWYCSEVVAR